MAGTDDLIAGYTELVKEQTKVGRAEKFYDGRVGNEFSSPRIRRLLAKVGIEDVEDINYAHIPVDTIANRLRVNSVTAMTVPKDPNAEPTESQDAAQALTKLRERNQLDFEEPGAFLETCKHGDGYILVWPVRDEAGAVVDVDIRFNSANNVRIVYDEEDPLKKKFTIKSWKYDEGRVRANLFYDDRIERWVTEAEKDPKDPKSWVHFDGAADPNATDVEEATSKDGWSLPNEWDENPWFHLRTARPYGRPEHKNAYGPQQLINKLVTAHAASIDFQSFPQRYALTDPKADNVQAAFGNPLRPFDEVEDPEDEDNATTLRADPAAVWQLVAKAVGQFDPADPQVFMKPFDRYVQAMAEVCETPLYRFGSSFAQTPSGEALRVANAPVDAKIEARQDAFGAAEADAYTLALKMLGITDVQVQVKWAPAQVVTDAEGWGVVEMKQRNGVPQKVALMETGYTSEQIDGWLEDMQDAIGLEKRLEMLGSFSSSAQSLGAAASLGVLTDDQVQLVLISLLGDMLPEDQTPAIEHDLGQQDPNAPPGLPPAQPIGPPPGQPAGQPDLGAQQDAQYQLVN
jgi:hypothetical protein